ncbi:hypothetical protein BS47DRAFT_1375971 [Hydnum rufescens UP504]|uniref:TauD/TfdA-like domain-containing protein n=1 Tax=Hydnum rufescens UP504 TaxID=1448309 RepID=A0A9P6B2Y2_9AGAM|nr:hypothetical protein BS47DRAFT_1375971 [Hydnum rufescens UP504]
MVINIELSPLPLPPSANPSHFIEFGREVHGVDPGNLDPQVFSEIERLLYKHGLLLFRSASLSPEQQYALTRAFDLQTGTYGHGNNLLANQQKSILHPYLKSIPRVPQVQLVGNGVIHNHEGFDEVELKHLARKTLDVSAKAEEDELQFTQFYRWHMDAALYDLSPPRVTTLYGLRIPSGESQVVRYDDGTDEQFKVPLACTAFISTRTTFNALSPSSKSLAVRCSVKYAPHPFEWMAPAKSRNNGLGIESEGLEVPLSELPEWDPSKIKILPMLWKNPITGDLHLQVNPSVLLELIIAPIPASKRAGADGDAVFPDGAHITDLAAARELVYKLQRPSISPEFIYPHAWSEKDLILFHNQGLLHSAVGTLRRDQIRVFHQCHLAASADPAGPTEEDVLKWS